MKACVRKDYYVFPGKKNGLVFISSTTVSTLLKFALALQNYYIFLTTFSYYIFPEKRGY